ncbi:SDR family oxidoreductase [Candidatus Chloroploca asiatica]|uniref:NAD(P)-binding domain-containing protein n=1 Tax=Candidatus Chloroploca asiatica TaxID=1506545 RepID=A0A2H3KP65_9CHLR|nr:NAD(P)H-binding protein [Candidatus Chloroploca asiatica]PDV99968.1 hypothetical protein A9Q02_11075 [Candidatus Chloroploca asiatica]
MKVLVTGSTGFTGSYVVPKLLEKSTEVRCLVRSTSDTSILPQGQVELVYGDLSDLHSLKLALQGVDAIINVASIGFGHAPGIVQAALEAGVQRGVFVSTTAIFTSLKASSKKVRLAAEEVIQKSDLQYTIIRPTMIYGSSRDRNMCRLINYIRRFPCLPIVGNGKNLQQPVYVDNVAQAIVDSLLTESTLRKSYNISGAASLTFNQVIDTISNLLNKRIYKVYLPSSPVIGMLQFFERMSVSIPVKSEQIQRLNEDKAFDYTDAQRDFGYAPYSFKEGVTLQLRQMGLL